MRTSTSTQLQCMTSDLCRNSHIRSTRECAECVKDERPHLLRHAITAWRSPLGMKGSAAHFEMILRPAPRSTKRINVRRSYGQDLRATTAVPTAATPAAATVGQTVRLDQADQAVVAATKKNGTSFGQCTDQATCQALIVRLGALSRASAPPAVEGAHALTAQAGP